MVGFNERLVRAARLSGTQSGPQVRTPTGRLPGRSACLPSSQMSELSCQTNAAKGARLISDV
jgi:hypothetical protein